MVLTLIISEKAQEYQLVLSLVLSSTNLNHYFLLPGLALFGGGGQIFKKKERKERTGEVTVRPEIIDFGIIQK